MKTAKFRVARWIGTCAGVLMVVQMAGTVGAATLTVPNEFENTEGNTSTFFPFAAAAGVEYQQLYISSQFDAFGLEGALITSIGFRSETGVPFTLMIPDLEVRMSTTSREPSSLSPVLSSNFGPDVTTVFRGQFRLTGSTSGEIVIVPLAKPFHYQPKDGNILFSFNNHVQWSSFPTPRFDTHNYPRSGPNPAGFALNIPGEPGSAGGWYGLVTIFQFEAIPEPSTWSLCLIALIGFMIYKKRSHVTL